MKNLWKFVYILSCHLKLSSLLLGHIAAPHCDVDCSTT